MAHTPGPWRTWPADLNTTDVCVPGSDPDYPGPLICPVYGRNHEANARLIAAAPEMYEALQPFAAICGRAEELYRKRGGNPDSFPDSHPSLVVGPRDLTLGDWRKARAALARVQT